MKKYALLIFLLSLGIADYAISNNPANQYIESIHEMEKALEHHFNCEIDSTTYSLIVWHQRLAFGLSKNSKTSISKEEAKEFSSLHFADFQYVDEFTIR